MKRIVNIEIQLIFYSVVIAILSFPFNHNLSVMYWIKNLFPVCGQNYWYYSCYVVMLLLAPFINKLIGSINKQTHLLLIFVGGACIFGLFSADPFYNSTIFLGQQSHSILWFLYLYVIAAYLRIYGVKINSVVASIIFCSIFLLGVLLKLFNDYYSTNIFERVQILDNDGVIAFLLTISSFVLFLNLKVNSKLTRTILKWIAPSLAGVYIIQEHDAVRDFFWNSIAVLFKHTHNPFIIALVAFIVLLIAAIIFNKIYQFINDKFFDGLATKIEEKCKVVIYKMCNRGEKL